MNRIILILLNGHAGVGKDTFVKMCKGYTTAKVLNYHRSDRAKTAMRILGWEDEIGKPHEIRKMMKDMVDYMERIGTLDNDLSQYIEMCSFSDRDQYIFYHVRDPKIIKQLTDKYREKHIEVISLLLTRNVENAEPEWWEGLEEAPNYDIHIQLPKNDMLISEDLAKNFVNILDNMIIVQEE